MAEETTTEEQGSQQTEGTQTGQGSETTAEQGPGKDTGAQQEGGTLEQGQNGAQETGDGDQGTSEGEGTGEEKGELQAFREKLAGGDEGILKALERYKSIDGIAKAFREARNVAKNAKGPMRLPEKPSEDDVKAYREAYGIPDDPKEYPAAFREDYQASDADKEILTGFKEYMHESNADPRAAQAALEWYQDFAQAQQQERDSRLASVAKETQTSLRNEWGGDYDGNIGAVQEFMTAQLGQDGFNRMMDLRLEDGSRLQDDPAFVKMMAQVATDYYGSNAIFNGDIETTAKTVQEQIDELLKLRGGSKEDQEKYFSDATQAKLTGLYAQRDKINARKG